jgi:hypothetical protein
MDEAALVLEYHRGLQDLAVLAAGIDEDHPAADRLNEAGRLCRRLGREREARAWFTQSLQLDPTNRETRAALENPDVRPTAGEIERTSRAGGAL